MVQVYKQFKYLNPYILSVKTKIISLTSVTKFREKMVRKSLTDARVVDLYKYDRNYYPNPSHGDRQP